MRFHAFLVVRDEGDIIEQSLRHLMTWADAVYVFDTGSCDETWDLVRQFAAKEHRVIPLGRNPVFFSDKRVRSWVFEQGRRHMRNGDWFARVDADEFHHVSPRDFVISSRRGHETVVYHQYYDFHLRRAEVHAWRDGAEGLAERKRPIEERRRWFTISSYTEPRLCRYRESMQWPESVSFPYNAGYVAVERLPIRHYPHRDPPQLKRRCALRSIMMTEPENACARHWTTTDWRELVVADHASGLQFWASGTKLPEPHLRNHLAPLPKRMLQRVCHAACLSLMDRFRTGYVESSCLRPIPPELQARLKQELNND